MKMNQELNCVASPPSRTAKRSETPSTSASGTVSGSESEDDTTTASESRGDTSETNRIESGKGKKKRGRKATWQETQITDMVNIIVNNEALLRKLVFTNTKKAYNTEAHHSVLTELNEQYNKSSGKDFPFSVKQMRSKFKWCVSICKNISLTIKNASGIKRIVEEKGYGKWFDLLFPFVKSRDSCNPSQAIEPGNNADMEGKMDRDTDCSDKGDSDEPPSKHVIVPGKKVTAKRNKTDQLTKAVALLNKVIENDPTKEMLQLLREEMKESREQEMRYFQMMCNMITPNQGTWAVKHQHSNPVYQPFNQDQSSSSYQQVQCQDSGFHHINSGAVSTSNPTLPSTNPCTRFPDCTEPAPNDPRMVAAPSHTDFQSVHYLNQGYLASQDQQCISKYEELNPPQPYVIKYK